MRSLAWILLGAVLSFQVVSILQEWPTFAAAWTGAPRVPARVALTSEERQGAERTLHEFHALSRHLYASGADPRFTERLPASPGVVEELLADVAYLQHRGLAQDARLVRLDVVAARPSGETSVVLDTREYWIVHVTTAGSGDPTGPARSRVFSGTYRLDQAGGRWRVGAWDVVDEAAP